MRGGLLVGVLLFGLSACVPAPRGSVSTFPLALEPARVLPVSPGGRWYVQGLYDQASYQARALFLANGELARRQIALLPGSATVVFGVDPLEGLRFFDPFGGCDGPRGEQAARFRLQPEEAPPGWSVGLFSAAFLLRCAEPVEHPLPGLRGNDPEQPAVAISLEFTLALRLLYAVGIPPSTPPGSYPLRLKVTYYPSGRTVTETLLFQVQPSR